MIIIPFNNNNFIYTNYSNYKHYSSNNNYNILRLIINSNNFFNKANAFIRVKI